MRRTPTAVSAACQIYSRMNEMGPYTKFLHQMCIYESLTHSYITHISLEKFLHAITSDIKQARLAVVHNL